MKMHRGAFAGALLILLVGPAAAGPCTQQINELASLLGWQDAGSGPTPGASTSATSTSVTQPQQPTHPPAAATAKATEGKATSGEDAHRQTTGRPTAGDQAQGAQSSVASDQPAARAALEHARTLDTQGSDECKLAVQEARRLTGLTQ